MVDIFCGCCSTDPLCCLRCSNQVYVCVCAYASADDFQWALHYYSSMAVSRKNNTRNHNKNIVCTREESYLIKVWIANNEPHSVLSNRCSIFCVNNAARNFLTKPNKTINKVNKKNFDWTLSSYYFLFVVVPFYQKAVQIIFSSFDFMRWTFSCVCFIYIYILASI